MGNPELEVKYNLPTLPPEPHVIVKNGSEERLSLREALQAVVEFEEKRKISLSGKVTKVGEFHHGSAHPPSKHNQRDAREALGREIKKTPNALSYPIILCILRSPWDEPFQIPSGLSPLSESFPAGGETNPFYRFICDRKVKEAAEILNRPQDLETLWNIFSYRLELHQKVFNGELPLSIAIDEILKFSKKINFPEDLSPFVREIADIIPLRKSNGDRRF